MKKNKYRIVENENSLSEEIIYNNYRIGKITTKIFAIVEDGFRLDIKYVLWDLRTNKARTKDFERKKDITQRELINFFERGK